MTVLYLVIGGSAGTLLRWVLAGLFQRLAPADFPWGILIVNVLGCFIAGMLAGLGRERLTPQQWLMLTAGFCGAFTTFSTLIVDTAQLADQGKLLAAAGNLIASVVIGLAAFRIGMLILK